MPGSARTPLGRNVAASTPDEQLSGFRLMPLGPFSCDTLLELARRATVSLVLQYHHFEADESGRTLLRALRDAAARGVRVRLLIDDLYTGGQEDLFTGFAAHPNIGCGCSTRSAVPGAVARAAALPPPSATGSG